MKQIMIFSSMFLLMILTSCVQVNTVDQETYDQLMNYHEKIGKKCIVYINNDSSLSPRTKNTLLQQYESTDKVLKTKLIVKK